MDIGLLAAPLSDRSLESVVHFAKANEFGALEVAAGPGSPHLDTAAMKEQRGPHLRPRGWVHQGSAVVGAVGVIRRQEATREDA